MSWQQIGDVAARVVEQARPNATAVKALCKIARGRADNRRPLAGEDARQLARETLVDLGINWSGDREDAA